MEGCTHSPPEFFLEKSTFDHLEYKVYENRVVIVAGRDAPVDSFRAWYPLFYSHHLERKRGEDILVGIYGKRGELYRNDIKNRVFTVELTNTISKSGRVYYWNPETGEIDPMARVFSEDRFQALKEGRIFRRAGNDLNQ